MKKGDWILIIAVILISGVMFVISLTGFLESGEKTVYKVQQGNQIIYSSSEDKELFVPVPDGEIHLLLKNGTVKIISSPCSEQFCVRQGVSSRSIVCLPEQLSVVVKKVQEKTDAISY